MVACLFGLACVARAGQPSKGRQPAEGSPQGDAKHRQHRCGYCRRPHALAKPKIQQTRHFVIFSQVLRRTACAQIDSTLFARADASGATSTSATGLIVPLATEVTISIPEGPLREMIAPSVQRPLATVVIVGLVHGIRPATTKAEIELWKNEVLFSELMRQLKCGWRTVVDGIVLLHSEMYHSQAMCKPPPFTLLRASLQPVAGERPRRFV